MASSATKAHVCPQAVFLYPQKAPISHENMAGLVRRTTQELKTLASEVRLIEREVEDFMHFYYAEVGEAFEAFQKTQQEKEVFLDEAEEDLFLLDPDEVLPSKNQELVQQLSKKIFRRAAKLCHPDTQRSEQKKALFLKLNDAYQLHDLGNLVLLEQQLQDQFGAESERVLEEQLDMMERAREMLEERRIELMESPTYKLRQRVFWAKMGGQDLLAQIKRHLERQVMFAGA